MTQQQQQPPVAGSKAAWSPPPIVTARHLSERASATEKTPTSHGPPTRTAITPRYASTTRDKQTLRADFSCPNTPLARGGLDGGLAPLQAAASLLTLPDALLLAVWDLLDASSRAALYHTCRQLWASPALGSRLRTLTCHTQRLEQDLLTWPRHALHPTTLKLMNGGSAAWSLVEQLAPLPPLQAAMSTTADEALAASAAACQAQGVGEDGTDSECQPGDRNSSCFVCFLSKARKCSQAGELLADVETVVLQGRGKDCELCKHLPSLLGELCPRLSSLQLDWCVVGGGVFAAANCWLPTLRRLSLVGLNAQDARGAWPHALVTYSDLAALTQLTHLEVVDCHLPFLELGVQDVTPLVALSRLESLRLIFSDQQEHPWPGSKPCYLLLGLEEVAQACKRLSELVLDGVHLAKVQTGPRWPSLTSLALGYLSGCYAALLTNMAVHQAPKLKYLSLGPLRCTGGSMEARRLNLARVKEAVASLAACTTPPQHLDLQVPASYLDAVPLADVLAALAPLGSPTPPPYSPSMPLVSLGLETDAVQERDALELARIAPHLQRLQLKLRRPSVAGLSALVERLPLLEVISLLGPNKRLAPSSSVGVITRPHGEPGTTTWLAELAQPAALEANMLGCAYAAFSTQRDVLLTIAVQGATPFAALCANELGQLRAHNRKVQVVVSVP